MELDYLMKDCEEATQQRTLLWEEQQAVAEVIMNIAQSDCENVSKIRNALYEIPNNHFLCYTL